MCQGKRPSSVIRNIIWHKRYLFLINYKNCLSNFSVSVHSIITMTNCVIVSWLVLTRTTSRVQDIISQKFDIFHKKTKSTTETVVVWIGSRRNPTWESVQWASRPQQKGGLPVGKAEVCVVTGEMKRKQISHVRELCSRNPCRPLWRTHVSLPHRGQPTASQCQLPNRNAQCPAALFRWIWSPKLFSFFLRPAQPPSVWCSKERGEAGGDIQSERLLLSKPSVGARG